MSFITFIFILKLLASLSAKQRFASQGCFKASRGISVSTEFLQGYHGEIFVEQANFDLEVPLAHFHCSLCLLRALYLMLSQDDYPNSCITCPWLQLTMTDENSSGKLILEVKSWGLKGFFLPKEKGEFKRGILRT